MGRSWADGLLRGVIGAAAAAGLVILVAPVLIVLVLSFSSANTLRFPPPGFSVRWFQALFSTTLSGQIHAAALNSLLVAVLATLLGIAVVLPASLGLRRRRCRCPRDGISSLPRPSSCRCWPTVSAR